MAEPAGIHIQFDGLTAAQEAMHRMAERGDDLRPIYDEIGNAAVASQQRRFELGIEPDGTPWMPSWRAGHVGGKTLINTGSLLGRLTHQSDDAGVEWGFQDRRAPTLHFGAVIYPREKPYLAFQGVQGEWIFAKNVVIPARPMVGVDAADIEEFGAIVGDAFERSAAEKPS